MDILAIVLTGGRSSRLGGRHKPAVEIGGTSVVDRVIGAVREADRRARIVVAGSGDGITDPSVDVVREDPPFAGPVAGVAAALAAVAADPARTVVLLAGDMPFVTPDLIRALVRRAGEGAAVADDGHPQMLCAAWQECALRDALARLGDPADAAMRALARDVDLTRVPADPTVLRDIDTPEDLARARRLGDDGSMSLTITSDPASDELLSENPLALLIGMLLDQQVAMETAFAGPEKIRQRTGSVDAAEIAGYDPDAFVEVFRETPAVHRFPGSMAGRVQKLCQEIVAEWGGDAAAIWTDGEPSGAEVLKRLKKLPGFGDQKAKIFLALLGKQVGFTGDGWQEASSPYGDDGSFRSVADITGPESLAQVRETKKAMKAAAKK